MNSCLLLVHSSDTPAVTTAVYSTCGLGVGIFCIAALLSLPKQFMLIYIGVLVEQTDKGGPPLFFSVFFFFSFHMLSGVFSQGMGFLSRQSLLVLPWSGLLLL
jgi:hypothetical protein